MTECLIVTPLADEFVAEVDRLSDSSIPVVPCRSAAELRANYQAHKVLFGNPGIIAEVLDQMPDVEWLSLIHI